MNVFPRWLYHEEHGAHLFPDEAHLESWGADGWFNSPDLTPESAWIQPKPKGRPRKVVE